MRFHFPRALLGTNRFNTVFRNQEQPWTCPGADLSTGLRRRAGTRRAPRRETCPTRLPPSGSKAPWPIPFWKCETDFYQILLDQALVDVRQQSVALLEEQLRDAQSRFDVGSVPRFNVLRAEVELENAKPPLIRAQNDLRLSKESLVKLLALDGSNQTNAFTPINFRGKLVYEHRDWDLPAALEQALQHRPELLSADRQIAVAQANVQVASSGYKPQASVFGNWGWHDLPSAPIPMRPGRAGPWAPT
jgi:hypothetical protein